ncbi:MAG TPA: hypothetical protein VGZ01_09895 [Trinickia sp.]|nr:hypothetical protein [Trinickia sp.]
MAQIPPLSPVVHLHGEMARAGGFAIAGTVAIVGIIAIKAISPKTITTKR